MIDAIAILAVEPLEQLSILLKKLIWQNLKMQIIKNIIYLFLSACISFISEAWQIIMLNVEHFLCSFSHSDFVEASSIYFKRNKAFIRKLLSCLEYNA
jgi:hypothetical protein